MGSYEFRDDLLDREHDLALQRHDRAWERMHAIGLAEGRDTDAYAMSREDVIERAREVRRASQRAAGARRWRRR